MKPLPAKPWRGFSLPCRSGDERAQRNVPIMSLFIRGACYALPYTFLAWVLLTKAPQVFGLG